MTLPIPPKTAAMKAFSPGRMPMKGLTWGYFMAHRSPPAPARSDPRRKVKAMIRLTSMPMRLTVSRSEAMARMARPTAVR